MYVWHPKRKWNKIRVFFRVLFLYSSDSVRMDSVWFMCIEHKSEMPWASRLLSQKEEWKRNETKRPTIQFQVHCTHSLVEWKRQSSTKSIVASLTFCGFDAQYDANDNHTHTDTNSEAKAQRQQFHHMVIHILLFLVLFFFLHTLFIYAMNGMNMQMPLKKCVGSVWWKKYTHDSDTQTKCMPALALSHGIRDSMNSTHGQPD